MIECFLLNCLSSLSHRDLGVLLSSDLSWSSHFDHICANAYKSLGLLRRTFSNYHAIEAKKTLWLHYSC